MASFYEDASLVVIPSGYKTSKIYAEKPTDGSGDLTFTRASDATRVGPDGLIEKVRTNLILQSQDFSTTWSANSCTVATNTTANPLNGAVNADTITFTGGTTQKYVIQAFSFNGNYTVSAYLKAGTNQFVQFLLGSDAGLYANFDLVNGTASATGSTATIVAAGNGWFRCSMSFTSTTGTHVFILAVDSLAATRFSTTSSTGTLIAFGYQLEAGDIATNYIPTTTAAVSVGPVSNVPRLDYLGSSCPRLLLEPQRTNLVTYSEQFDNAAWTKNQITLTANFATSPDGSTNADRAMETSADAYHDILGSFSATSGTVYTASCFVKSAGQNLIYIYISTGTAAAVKFNLSTGTVIGTALGTVVGSKITNYGNGWYRCEVSYTAGATTTATISISTTNSTALSLAPYIGDPTKGILVYGYQVEAGAYATSYIPTLGASVTRVADAASKTGISSLIGQTEGTFFVEIDLKNAPVDNSYILLRDAAVSDYLGLRIQAGNLRFETVDNGVLQTAINYIANTPQTAKVAMAYKLNDFVMYVNGTQVGTDTSATVPTCDILDLNFNAPTANAFGIAQALLFKTRLTNAQLAELTTL
jgi:hypothetical protein